LKIAQKEAWDNAANQNEYVEKAKICGIYEGQIIVPMLWDAKNSKCLVGAEPIIEFVRQQLDAAKQQPNK
jgi:glutathionyl-hydroquinone reductase